MRDGVKFCTNCGQKLYEESQTAAQPQVQPQTQIQPQPQVQPQPYYPQGYYPVPPKKKSKAPLVVLLVCLMVFILGGYDDIMDAIKDFSPEESVAFFNGEDLQEFLLITWTVT